MKYSGCQAVCHRERARDLLRAYFHCVRESPRVFMPDIFQSVVEMPASQFWVSVPRAASVVSRIFRGDSLSDMRPNKREMFLEIHRRVLILQASHPSWTLYQLVREVVCQPAPKFYLEPGSARYIILKERKLWFKTKAERRSR